MKENKNGNCLALTDITILTDNKMTPTEAINCSHSKDYPESANKIVYDKIQTEILTTLDSGSEYIVPYIAGFVTKKLLNTLKCEQCIEAILNFNTPNTSHCKYALIQLKDKGGLIYPSADVIAFCKLSEQAFRATTHDSKINQQSLLLIQVNMVLKKLQSESSQQLFKNLKQHSDQSVEFNHYFNLIRCIADEYLRIKNYCAVSKIINKWVNRRKFYNKLILNKSQ